MNTPEPPFPPLLPPPPVLALPYAIGDMLPPTPYIFPRKDIPGPPTL